MPPQTPCPPRCQHGNEVISALQGDVCRLPVLGVAKRCLSQEGRRDTLSPTYTRAWHAQEPRVPTSASILTTEQMSKNMPSFVPSLWTALCLSPLLFSFFLSFSFYLSVSHAHTHTQKHTPTPTLYMFSSPTSRPLTPIPLSLSHSLTHQCRRGSCSPPSLSLFLSLFPGLFILSLSLSLSHSLPHSLYLPLSLSPSLSLSLSLSLCLFLCFFSALPRHSSPSSLVSLSIYHSLSHTRTLSQTHTHTHTCLLHL